MKHTRKVKTMNNNVIHPNHYNIPGRKECIEEMSELTQAICKYKRKHGERQSILDMVTYGRVEENLIEELADVKLVLGQVIHLLDCDDTVQEIMEQKINRTLERIGEQNAGN